MHQARTLMSIAATVWLVGVLTVGCSLERYFSTDREKTSVSGDGSTSERHTWASAIEPSPDGGSGNAASIAVRELPTDSFNAKIRSAARNDVSWASDPERIALQFWRDQVRDGYADDIGAIEPQLSKLPISDAQVGYIRFRVNNDVFSDGDDAIAREWTDLVLHRNTRTGLWQIERAATSAECRRGVVGNLCL